MRDELGFDVAFDYRTERLEEEIDVYFDNVGGPQLERAITMLRRGGRIALCGAVSQYNAVEPAPGPRNLGLMVGKRGLMRGFIVGDHADRDPEFRAEVLELISLRPSEARRDGRRRRAGGGAARVRRHARRAAPGQGGRLAVKRSAGVLLRRESGEVLLVHPGGPFWAKKDLGRVVDPQGRVLRRRGSRGRPRGGSSLEELGVRRPRPLADLGTVKQKNGKEVRGFLAVWRPRRRDVVSNTFTMEWPPRQRPPGRVPRGRPRRVVRHRDRPREAQPRAGGLPRPAGLEPASPDVVVRPSTSRRSGAPSRHARSREIAVEFDVAMPTCDAPGPLALKNTRSPAWMFARDTGTPTFHCWKLVRGRRDADLLEGVDEQARSSRSPRATCRRARTACRSGCATTDSADPPPPPPRRGRAGDPERAERRRPDHAVDLEPVPRLERLHRGARLRPIDAVRRDPQLLLHGDRHGPARLRARCAWWSSSPTLERRPGHRPDDPVDLEPMARLERLDGPLRLPPEDPVRGDAQRLLDRHHRRPREPFFSIPVESRRRRRRLLSASRSAPTESGSPSPPARSRPSAPSARSPVAPPPSPAAASTDSAIAPTAQRPKIPTPGRQRQDRPTVVVHSSADAHPNPSSPPGAYEVS